jgi:RNA polymerase sigma-70 factor (ECF subfamily)
VTDGPGLARPDSVKRDTQQGEGLAIEGLARRYSGALRSFFAKRTRGADLDDLVQEVLVRLVARSRGEAIENPEGYVFQTAANLLRDRARQHAARSGGSHGSFEETEHGAVEISPERVLLSQEAIEMLVRALDELPQRTRDVFVLHRYDGLEHREIARRLGISESAVWKHMGKAVTHLHARMERSKS